MKGKRKEIKGNLKEGMEKGKEKGGRGISDGLNYGMGVRLRKGREGVWIVKGERKGKKVGI